MASSKPEEFVGMAIITSYPTERCTYFSIRPNAVKEDTEKAIELLKQAIAEMLAEL